MAGGGNTVIKGLMSKVTCDIDPKEVDKMSDEINNDQRRVRHYSFRIVSLLLIFNTPLHFLMSFLKEFVQQHCIRVEIMEKFDE